MRTPAAPRGFEIDTEEDFSIEEPVAAAFRGGRMHIVGAGPAEVVSTSVISLPVQLKLEGDERLFTLNMSLKLDSLVACGDS